MNYRLVLAILGRLLMFYSTVMIIPFVIAVINKESSLKAFLVSIIVTGVLGLILKNQKNLSIRKMGTREAIAVVAGAWISAILLGALPFSFSDTVSTYVDALFEAASGLTTTGASIISDVEVLPSSILLWRSLTHWLGGMGIIVLFIVLLPNTGVGAVHLFNAEVTGPMSERIMPRIRDTALTLWKIYIFLTAVLILLLWQAGMSFFDAINHAFSTMATGGFSTKNISIAFYDNLLIELIISFFAILASLNFGIFLLTWRKKSLKPFRNPELLTFLLIISAATFLIAGSLWLCSGESLGYALRHAFFQVASITTSTGFSSADFNLWPAMTKLILLILMFIGGCAGSTAGGIKVSRIMILVKSIWNDLKKGVHPNAVSNVKLGGKPVNAAILNRVGVFFFLYMLIFALASIIIAGTGLEPFDAISAVAACLGSTGPGFGEVGPTTTFAGIGLFGKSILIFCMLLGRLEFFTLLILIRPEFWIKRKGW
ncbi:MAG TPA: TrkH family potassium uptake protein [Desulfitobacteriaceae bacterium]|jgi:trk system potassium uptake protein TrkH|nr:TrkH family potassium uptake protein [Desulfitobacteriaceae bacterium]